MLFSVILATPLLTKNRDAVTSGSPDLIFHCKKCKNTTETTKQKKKNVGPLNCEICNYFSNTEFNLKRHISRKHRNGPVSTPVVPSNKDVEKSPTLESILKDIDLDNLAEKLKKEGIDVELLLDLNTEDLRRMLKDLQSLYRAPYLRQNSVIQSF